MKNITRILSAALALCLLAALCLPARADGTQDCGAKLLAITFDDGPGKYTGALLDGLAERGVHATFFVNGVNASGWPETLKRIVNEGHQLANHTYNHKNLNTCSAQTVAYEISAVQALITAAGGDENAYIRAPYGNANKTVKSVVTAPLIYWSVDPEDWKYRNAETVRSNIEAGVFDGAIILVHDIYKTSVDGALAAIDDLLAEGYEFVTVQDLLLRRGVTPEAATVYYSAKNNGINLPADAVGEQAFDESRIETHWGYAAMKTCLDYGWMMLTDTGEWKPNAFVTRAEFAADLARFAGIHTLYPLEGAARFSEEQFCDFIDEMYAAEFEYVYESTPDFYTDSSRAQAHLYVRMEDETVVELRLFEGGYVGYQHMGWYFVKMPGAAFDAVFAGCR